MSPLFVGLVTPFIVNKVIFIIAQLKQDNSIVDIGWGLLFITANLAALVQLHGS